ncbi:isopeptide-forming domain-containing fimbrial protein [Deinococcus sp. QL22]|uniref:DUF7933 domain-containing protein n=1 Tax=Deinococcus sp. QL22 TaxID=2939437 RepID=UPI00201826E8|nr:isopeptide-forming domain-containing fimbrial protein [Deinococcus sp. QL22]UQN07810.1 isopeptide-forming domain-containing fimbrial protein [Deinococcus sp. QL22]
MGTAMAAPSYCTATYVITSAATQQVGYFNFSTNAYVPLFTAASTNSNALAESPVNGFLYYIERNNNQLRYINPATGVDTLVGSSPAPASGASVVGGTFDTAGNYYVYYSNGRYLQLNPATGAQVGGARTISGPAGYTLNATSNGDFAIDTAGQVYIIVEANTNGGSTYNPYVWRLDVASGVLSNPVALRTSGGTLWTGTVNGLSIDPFSNTVLVSSATGAASTGGTAGLYSVNLTTGVTTLRQAVPGITDLGNCGIVPNAPTLSKSFNPSSLASASGTSVLTITVGNSNLMPIYTFADLIDTLPASSEGVMTVASIPNVGGTCLTTGTVTAPAGSRTVTLNSGARIPAGGCTITVNVSVSAAGTYTNTLGVGALVTSTGTNASAASSTLPVGADLAITKTDNVSSVTSGSATTYTVRVTNNGPNSVTGAILKDPAASGLTKTTVACSPTTGACTAGTTPTVTQLESAGGYALPTLVTGAFYELRITATATAASGSVSNTATVDAPAGTTDSTLGNNTSTDTNTITVDVGIDKAGPAFAKPTEAYTYTVTVTNTTAGAATNVTVSDTLPAGLTFVRASDGGTYNSANRTVTWTLASLAGNATKTLTLTVTAPAAAAISPTGGIKSVQNTATVSVTGDSNAGNNTSAAVTTRFVLTEVVKRVRNVSTGGTFGTSGGGKPAEVLEYCLDARNLGGANLPNYVLTDQVPSSVSALITGYDVDEPSATTGFGIKLTRGTTGYRTSAADADTATLTTTGGSFGQGIMTLSLGTLTAGETVTACFQATIR